MNKQADQKSSEKAPRKFKNYNPVQTDEIFPQAAQVDEDIFKSASTISTQPEAVTPSMILSLQSTIGNHDVQRLLAPKPVLPPQATPPTPKIAKTSTIKPALQRDETEEEGEESAEEDLDTLLERIGILADPPEVPAFEAITGTTAGEFSGGELEGEIGRLWSHDEMSFTTAARTAAEENTSSDHGPVATNSPEIAPEAEYAHRWSVNLYAWDYPDGRTDLDLTETLRARSPFQRALQEEFERVIPVENPTAAGMYSAVFDAIMGLSQTIEPNQTAELIVTFSGHGRNGTLFGVDWSEMGTDQLQSLANVAQDFRVHLVYILDTCRAGIVASVAQDSLAEDISEHAEGLPAERRAQIEQQLGIARQLGNLLAQISGITISIGDTLRHHVHDGSVVSSFFIEYFRNVNQVIEHLNQLREYLGSEELSAEGGPSVAPLLARLDPASSASLGAMGGERREGTRMLRQMAELLDAGNNVINTILVSTNAASTTAPAAPEAAPVP